MHYYAFRLEVTKMAEVINIPLVPLRGMTIFPNMIVHLDVGRDRSVNAIEAAMVEERKIFLVAQKTLDNESPTRDDLYEVGTISEIRQIMKLPDGNIRVLVEGMNRGILVGYREFENYAEVDVEVHEDHWDDSLNMEALIYQKIMNDPNISEMQKTKEIEYKQYIDNHKNKVIAIKQTV